jgi:Dolichyl-phosphate-mannose-protein mannosyltransferase
MQQAARASRGSNVDWMFASATLVVAAVMCIRIISTYSVFTQTYDEPFHIACGMEWLDRGVYNYEAQHPPLSRIAAALGPYIAGERSHGSADLLQEGNTILGEGARYKRNLTLARLGELPFVLLALAGVWVWARRCFGPQAAFFSALVFSMIPTVLAHGGFATTDLAITATCTWAFYSYMRFLEGPSPQSSLLLGFWCGLALISKFTALLFLGCGFPVITAIYLACTGDWRKVSARNVVRVLRLLAPALAVSMVLVWACYRFTLAPLFPAEELVSRSADFSPTLTQPGIVHTLVTKVPVPAGQFFRGFGQVWRHNKNGQWAYLLGERRDSGWWYFFPVVLGLKTPIGFLALMLCGIGALVTRLRDHDWKSCAPVVFAVIILLACMPSRLNIGIRHILPMYPLLSMATGYFVAQSIAQSLRFRTTFALGCLAWACASSMLAHPDYLAYFNEIANTHPENYRVDSDLDWGQDLGRLSKRLRELPAPSLEISYFGSADLTKFELPKTSDFPCEGELRGYVAVSLSMLYLYRPVWSECPQRFEELRHVTPSERIGKSILLYYFPPHT